MHVNINIKSTYHHQVLELLSNYEQEKNPSSVKFNFKKNLQRISTSLEKQSNARSSIAFNAAFIVVHSRKV